MRMRNEIIDYELALRGVGVAVSSGLVCSCWRGRGKAEGDGWASCTGVLVSTGAGPKRLRFPRGTDYTFKIEVQLFGF
jgi:hypothetical protein